MNTAHRRSPIQVLTWLNVAGHKNEHSPQAVTHPSTNTAQCCLTSVIRRELVFSTWYGRIQLYHLPATILLSKSLLLNFSDWTRTGLFNMVWLYTIICFQIHIKIPDLMGFYSIL